MGESRAMEVPASTSSLAGEGIRGPSIALRALVLAAVFVVASAAAGVLIGAVAPSLQNWQPAHPWSPGFLVTQYIVALLYAVAVVAPLLRSRWRGWPLALTVFWAMTAMTVVLPWIELVAFNLRDVGPAGLEATFVVLTISWAVFAPSAVFLFGRFASDRAPEDSAPSDGATSGETRRLSFGIGGWVGRLAAIAIAYVVLYFVFGSLVWFLSPELRAFYSSTEMPGIGTILPTQFGRGLLWAAVALPIVRMMRGPRWETVLAIGLMFGVVMSAALLLPNPLLAEDFRYFHLFETVTSNFLLGLFVGWILTPPETLEAASESATEAA